MFHCDDLFILNITQTVNVNSNKCLKGRKKGNFFAKMVQGESKKGQSEIRRLNKYVLNLCYCPIIFPKLLWKTILQAMKNVAKGNKLRKN